MITSKTCNEIPTFDFEIKTENLMRDAAAVVKHFFPGENPILKKCDKGITNILVEANLPSHGFKILIRTFGRGSSVLIDRSNELQVFIF
jgi:hypothetical protein